MTKRRGTLYEINPALNKPTTSFCDQLELRRPVRASVPEARKGRRIRRPKSRRDVSGPFTYSMQTALELCLKIDTW